MIIGTTSVAPNAHGWAYHLLDLPSFAAADPGDQVAPTLQPLPKGVVNPVTFTAPGSTREFTFVSSAPPKSAISEERKMPPLITKPKSAISKEPKTKILTRNFWL
jgi:hypothetical protein